MFNAMTALLLLMSGPMSGSAGAQPSSPTPMNIGFDQRLGARVPLNLEFRDEAGRLVRLADYIAKDRPVVLVLAYYGCPMLCTLVLNGLVASLKATRLEAGADFEVVVVSFDPREAPELARRKKAAYMRVHDRPDEERAFHFLTGAEGEIRQLTEAVGFRYAYDPVAGQFAHASGLVVLTPEGVVSRYLYGVDYEPRDVRLALVEAAGGAIGDVTDKLLLLCYDYDPARGRYGAMALGAVRGGGVLTVLALGGAIVVMNRRRRRAERLAPRGGA
jgi:protein SCO1/2